MLKFFTKHLKNKKGFTLVELIVVIAILGVLAMIAVPRMGSFRSDAARSTHNANVRTLESAANMYLAENGVGTLVEWKDILGGAKPGKDDTWGKYIAEWPRVPKGVKTENGNLDDKEYTVKINAEGVVTVAPPQVPDKAPVTGEGGGD